MLDDAVVEAALKTVTGIANLAHSVMHPRDKEFAKEVLRILKAKGHKLAPDQIKSWAIRSGWLPKAAQELADVAKKIDGLKNKPSLSGVYNADERYKRWKAEAVPE